MPTSDKAIGFGISLPRSLCERVDEVARAQDRTRSWVIRTILELNLPPARDMRKTQAHTASAASGIPWGSIDGDDAQDTD